MTQRTRQASIKKRSRLSGPERKRQILQIAVDLFSRHGFQGTTMRRLAKRAGVSEAMIYHHFPSKEALYDAILEVKLGEIESLLPVEAAERRDDEAVFRTLVNHFLQRQEDDSSFMRLLLFSALEGHEMTEKFVQGPRQTLFGFLTSYLQGRSADSALRGGDARVTTRLLFGMAFYVALLRQVLGDTVLRELTLDQLTESIVNLFCRGILSHESEHK